MKKSDLKKIALLGLTAGLVCSCSEAGGENPRNGTNAHATVKMTEQDLMTKLDDNGRRIFSTLSPEGKDLALQLASQSCKGQNSCAGLNSCKTADHSCAGLGSCKGTSPGPFQDKNDAVKAAAKKMAQKRQNATKY